MAISDLDRGAAHPLGTGATTSSALAASMIEAAIDFCEQKTGLRGRSSIAAALKAEDPQVHEYFRHSLANDVAEQLGRLDDGVLEVYTHSCGDLEEEGVDRSCGVAASINLIVRVRRRTAALASFIASLDEALLAGYQALVAPSGAKMASLLDVQFADDRDVEQGIGYGAVLKSLFVRPTRLWPR